MFGMLPASARVTFDAFSPAFLRWSLNDSGASIVKVFNGVPVLIFLSLTVKMAYNLFLSGNEQYLVLFCSKASEPISYYLNCGISEVLHLFDASCYDEESNIVCIVFYTPSGSGFLSRQPEP